MRLALLSLLVLLLPVVRCNVLLTYGPVWDDNPTGFALYDDNLQTLSALPAQTGRLVAPPRVMGVLAGRAYSVLFGSFTWVGATASTGLAYFATASAPAAVHLLPVTPSVFGAAVLQCVWRDESAGSFFALGSFAGTQGNPASRLLGVATCHLQSGCTSLTTGLPSRPSALAPVSMVYNARTLSLVLVYTTNAPSPEAGTSLGRTMFCQWQPRVGWTFIDVTPLYDRWSDRDVPLAFLDSQVWAYTGGQPYFKAQQCPDDPVPVTSARWAVASDKIMVPGTCWHFVNSTNIDASSRNLASTASHMVIVSTQTLGGFQSQLIVLAYDPQLRQHDWTGNINDFWPLSQLSVQSVHPVASPLRHDVYISFVVPNALDAKNTTLRIVGRAKPSSPWELVSDLPCPYCDPR